MYIDILINVLYLLLVYIICTNLYLDDRILAESLAIIFSYLLEVLNVWISMSIVYNIVLVLVFCSLF